MSAIQQLICFGPYELNLTSQELRKDGTPVRLTPQAFKLLALMASRPGDVVTREEIEKELWDEDTTVDFEHGVNKNINQIRTVLCDDADHPVYIETLPRRGYRFIAPVSTKGAVLADLAHTGQPDLQMRDQSSKATAELKGADAVTTPEPASDISRRAKRRSFWIVVSTAAALIIVLVAVGVYYRSRSHKPQTETYSVVLADFLNATGDAVFDDSLKQALAIGLQQSPFFKVLSDQKIGHTLQLMGRTRSGRFDEATARDVCLRAGSAAVLVGSISRLGNDYLLGLHALDCRTGDALAQVQMQAAGKEQIMSAMDKATTRLRTSLGESLASVERFNTPLPEATTASFDALKAYSLGLEANAEKGDADAIPFYKRSIELDPNFAIAYAALGNAYFNLGEEQLAAENVRKAYELRNRVSEREYFRITGLYYADVTGELEKAKQNYMLWAEAYPQDSVPVGSAAFILGILGQYQDGVRETLQQLHLEPDSTIGYSNLVLYYTALNRLDDAKKAYDQAIEQSLEYPFLHANRYAIAFLESNEDDMQRQVAWAIGRPGIEDVVLSAESDTEAFLGKLREARELSRRAIESAKGADEEETAAIWQLNSALREAEFGNVQQSRREVEKAMKLASTRDVWIAGALVSARAGNSRAAVRMAKELTQRYPLDTMVNRYWLRCILAAIELDRHNPEKAIELLEPSASYELGMPTPDLGLGGTLYPVFLRGQAYLALGRGDQAVREFQKYLRNRAIVMNFPLGALARLGLAKAYIINGQTVEAKSAYQDFITIWKNADPDVPILKQAKAAYAKLQ